LNHIAGGGLCVLVKLMPHKGKRQDLEFWCPCLFIIIVEIEDRINNSKKKKVFSLKKVK
jgi:hypothetical protein